MLYICDGFVYTYPNFDALGYETEYIITVSQNNPVQNTMYFETREYSSSRVIDTSGGSLFVGQFLTFNPTVNGSTNSYTVKL